MSRSRSGWARFSGPARSRSLHRVELQRERERSTVAGGDIERDPRDHVIDVGYFVQLDSAEAEALDETDEALWVSREELDARPLAFDHQLLWRRARERYLD